MVSNADDPSLSSTAGRFREEGSFKLAMSAIDRPDPELKGISMKKWTIAGLATALVSVIVPLAVVQVAAAGASNTTHQHQSGAITIQSWLHANPSANGLSATVVACFKVTGALTDQGGNPTWNDATYAVTSASSPASSKCGSAAPVGGYIMVPPPRKSANTLSTVYAVHTITGAKGQIVISFSGVYNLTTATSAGVGAYQGAGTWVITGGTGAYAGLQGDGTWAAMPPRSPTSATPRQARCGGAAHRKQSAQTGPVSLTPSEQGPREGLPSQRALPSVPRASRVTLRLRVLPGAHA